MTFTHKLKFFWAVMKGRVTKTTDWIPPPKQALTLPDFKESMNLNKFIMERKKFLESLIEVEQEQEIKEEIDQEYFILEEIEKLIKRYGKQKLT